MYGTKHALHVRRGAEDDWEPHPSALAYAPQSQCLVALVEGTRLLAPMQNPNVGAQGPMRAWNSELTVLDLAAGGRMLCRLADRQAECALHPLLYRAAWEWMTPRHPRAALRREDYAIAAVALLGGGSGSLAVTGSVRRGMRRIFWRACTAALP